MSPGWSTSVQMLSQVARLLHHLHRQGLRPTGLTEALNEIQSCVRASGKHIRHIRHFEWLVCVQSAYAECTHALAADPAALSFAASLDRLQS